jgi:type 1 glutamine amidotransferase
MKPFLLSASAAALMALSAGAADKPVLNDKLRVPESPAPFAGDAAPRLPPERTRRLILIAGKPSHPPLMHEFRAGCLLLQQCLARVPGLTTEVHTNGWVSDPRAFAGADAVFIYSDGGPKHPVEEGDHLQVLQRLVDRGVGVGFAHYAVQVDNEKSRAAFLEWTGGYYEHLQSVNPIWDAEFKQLPAHPVTRGVKAFTTKDEWYFNLTFRDGMKGLTPILVAQPGDTTRDGPYVYPKGPYPHIQAAKGRDEVLMWAVERPDGGRGFGFTGGHFHLNWGNDQQRKLILNALVWLAKAEVPANGVESKVTQAELMENLDDKPAPKPAKK